MNDQTIGFIGLGNMGAPMAGRLQSAGYALVVYDVREATSRAWQARGATAAASAAAVASLAEVVFLSLPTPDIVESVALGPGGLSFGSRVTHIVDLSTTGPDAARRIARELSDQGRSFVDAPVSGGVAGARAGTLAIMAGCDAAALARVAPQLQTLGKIYHVGVHAGMGQMVKLINNLLSACALAVSSEALTLAVKAGLDARTVIDVINAGSGRNSATLDKFPRQILPRSFDAGFTLGLMSKDVDLCMDQAEGFGLSLAACRVVRDTWSRASRDIGPEEDFTKIILAIEGPAGVVVRGAP
jgi:3-hydroxyisobutyrate dehydrogenase-like beta-hydroxyacid dehydrogenase